jgi:hypothetical protein
MSKEYYKKNKEKCAEWARLYYLKNKEKINMRNHLYSINNKEKRNIAAKKYTNKRKLVDENYRNRKKIHQNLQFILRKLRKGIITNTNFNVYLGCKTEEFKNHIEKLFKTGMTWENYGKNGWHIDHIIPRSKFDLTDESQIKICFNYSNLQPLWEFENRKKGSKYDLS